MKFLTVTSGGTTARIAALAISPDSKAIGIATVLSTFFIKLSTYDGSEIFTKQQVISGSSDALMMNTLLIDNNGRMHASFLSGN
jgi:hypothetical protein